MIGSQSIGKSPKLILCFERTDIRHADGLCGATVKVGADRLTLSSAPRNLTSSSSFSGELVQFNRTGLPTSVSTNFSNDFRSLFAGRKSFEIGGTTVVPFHGRSALDEPTLKLLSSAKESIDIDMFSFKSPEVIELLKEKLGKGVKLRILNEPVGRDKKEESLHRAAVNELKDAGAEVRSFPTLSSICQLNHAKMAVVDGQSAYLGGMNWGTSFQSDWAETGVFLSGNLSRSLRKGFENAWRISGGEANPIPYANKGDIQVLASQPGERKVGPEILKQIRDSESIDVTMYWMTSKDAIQELVEAHERGAQVRVLLGDESENHYALRRFKEAGIPVGVTPKSHHKVAMFDGKTSILGSGDWTAQAFYLNRELCLKIDDTELTSWLETHFEADWAERRTDISSAPGESDYKFLPHVLSLHSPALIQRVTMQMAGAAARVYCSLAR